MRDATRWAVASVLLSTGWAVAQSGTATGTSNTVMPGTPVGLPSVAPVGNRLPQVGSQLPRVGTSPSGYNGANPNSPFVGKDWPKPDPNLVVAPYPTPNLKTDSFWDKLLERWQVLFAGDQKPPTSTWTPGISRRNRERKEKREEELMRWRRD